MSKRGVLSLIVLTCGLSACHTPGGGWMPYSGSSQTYYSYETKPVTIEIVDLRSDEIVFRMDVPAGKQLTFDFVADQGDDPVVAPDLMRYSVWDIGTSTGSLTSSLSVPTATSRRVDVHYRSGAEYRAAPGESGGGGEEMLERPEWWTPEAEGSTG